MESMPTGKPVGPLTKDSIIEGLKSHNFKRIVFMTGAGISVSAGIPDFRSPKTGVYDNLAEFDLPYPEALFNIQYFLEKPEAFYRFAKSFKFDLEKYNPTPAHYFIKLLEDKGLMLINYTQNVDCLELKAGIPKEKVLQAHGSLDGAKCALCSNPENLDELVKKIEAGEVMRCSKGGCSGPVKPNVVFFGEALPMEFMLKGTMISECDLLIVMGTALAVSPFNMLVAGVPEGTPQVLINRENTKEHGFDFENHQNRLFWQGDCDDVVKEIVSQCGWVSDFQKLSCS